MKTSNWKSYNELAWTDLIVSSPQEVRAETETYCRTIIKNSKIKPQTLLHLGCGAGMNDYTFKRHFNVIGVDISKGMLDIAGRLNPEIRYIRGDMRELRIDDRFDAVVIPDSIGYMTTVRDLRKAINTAQRHLNPGGVLLIVAQLKNDFKENNFVYTGKTRDVAVTIFENNCITGKSRYEATITYLIRYKNKLETHTETHTIGLFDLATWTRLLKEKRFSLKKLKHADSYGKYLLEDGRYPQVIFVCRKLSKDL